MGNENSRGERSSLETSEDIMESNTGAKLYDTPNNIENVSSGESHENSSELEGAIASGSDPGADSVGLICDNYFTNTPDAIPGIVVTPCTPGGPKEIFNAEQTEKETNLLSFSSDEEDNETRAPKSKGKGLKNAFKIAQFTPREVHTGNVIGEGGFGRVLKGSLHGGTTIAIKLFHAPLLSKDTQSHSEFNRLLTIKSKHICKLIGIIPQTEQLECPQLILQYFPEGDLLRYLSRAENTRDLHTIGKICLDVVQGCQFLQDCGIVNGNLGARNVLIERVFSRDKTYFNAKLTDVGLIRFAEASGGNYFKLPGSNRTVPVRWVPNEILDNEDGSVGGDFTFQSDVWSYGVFLWEIWTRGAIPYGASYSNLRVVQFIKEGYSPLKVHRPSDCPSEVVSLLESIFKVNPGERPMFKDIYEHFKKYKGYGKANSRAKGATKDKCSLTKGEAQHSKKKKPVDASDKVKKLSPGKPEPPVSGPPASETTVPENEGAKCLPEKPKLKQEQRGKPPKEGKDTQIAALLKRVDQLEKERFVNRCGLGRGRGGTFHAPKRRGSPRFQQPQIQALRSDGGNGPFSQVAQGVPGQQAPPPYSEEPLPQHTSSQFNGPLPEYCQQVGLPGGRGRFPEGPRYPGNDPLRASSSIRSTPNVMEDDFIQKIKRLAEEIEVLRAEKMTQELLKKSSELADLMKMMSTGREDTNSNGGYISRRGRGMTSIPPRHMPPQGTTHFSPVPDGASYGDFNQYAVGDWWDPNHHTDAQSHPNFRGQHGHAGPRRYFKGRSRGNESHRGLNRRFNGQDEFGPHGA